MAQGQVDGHRSRFQQESDPVRKARAMPKFGEALLDHMGLQLQKGEVAGALDTLAEYRDAIVTSHGRLKASGINAEKKPSGFKQLEIHVRRGLRRLEDFLVAVPVEQRESFEQIRKQLDQVDRELIEMLFPRRPGPRNPSRRVER
jgi:hypothetical protein